MFGYFFGYGFILQLIALVHWAKRRPESYWLWIIFLGGWIGALAYIIVEVVPDFSLVGPSFKIFPRRKRIRVLRTQILDNPAPGNYEELGDLLLEDGEPAEARLCFDKAITPRSQDPHPYYGRAQAEMQLGDYAAALGDLEHVIGAEPEYDYHRAKALLAYALAQTGQPEKAATAFADATRLSTLSETQYNYAAFLHAQGRDAEARDWAQRILSKKATLPGYLKRRERPWFRKASALLKTIPGK
jgi:hypothetical protein